MSEFVNLNDNPPTVDQIIRKQRVRKGGVYLSLLMTGLAIVVGTTGLHVSFIAPALQNRAPGPDYLFVMGLGSFFLAVLLGVVALILFDRVREIKWVFIDQMDKTSAEAMSRALEKKGKGWKFPLAARYIDKVRDQRRLFIPMEVDTIQEYIESFDEESAQEMLSRRLEQLGFDQGVQESFHD